MLENNPSQAVSDGGVNAPAAGTENVTPVASLKDVVKQATGRDYQTDEAALEGIKNTYAMVGKKVEPQVIEKTILPEDVVKTVNQLSNELKIRDWYDANPGYRDAKDIIAKFGPDPSQVVADPTFQKVYGALKTANESGSKSTLSGNARIAMPQDRNADYANDLAAMRSGQIPVADFIAKHKGVPPLAE